MTDRPPTSGVKPLLRLLPLLAPHWPLLTLSLLALALGAAALLYLPATLRTLVEEGIGTRSSSAVDRNLLLFLGVAVAVAVFSSARMYVSNWVAERVATDLRKSVYRNLIRLDQEFFGTVRVGEVLSRLMSDVAPIQGALANNASGIVRSLIIIIGALALLLSRSTKLTASMLIIVPLLLAPMLIFGPRLRALSRLAQDKLAALSGFASESLSSMQTVQAFTLEGACSSRHEALAEESFKAAVSRTRVASISSVAIALASFTSIALLLWIGSRSVVSGEITGGQLTQVILYAVLAAQAVAGLSMEWTQVQRASGAMERLLELERAVPKIRAREPRVAVSGALGGALHFEHIEFSYPSRPTPPALTGVDLRIAPGECVALVGHSGAGKSTLLSLLLRFYDPVAGRITIDGVDISRVEPNALRRRIALVPQETVLFGISVRENIRLGRPEAGEADILAAARAAEVDTFIRELPQGYETQLGERGFGLSLGQRQRIAVARALLKDAPVLLLDEATNSLDAENEQLLQAAFARLMKNRTTLIIAHRLATVQMADRIVVLDRGRVVASGKHADLLRRSPLYARLAALQFMTEEVPDTPLASA